MTYRIDENRIAVRVAVALGKIGHRRDENIRRNDRRCFAAAVLYRLGNGYYHFPRFNINIRRGDDRRIGVYSGYAPITLGRVIVFGSSVPGAVCFFKPPLNCSNYTIILKQNNIFLFKMHKNMLKSSFSHQILLKKSFFHKKVYKYMLFIKIRFPALSYFFKLAYYPL